LVKVFLHDAAKAFSLPSKTPDGRLIEHLQRLPWPGNVRELRHVCQSLAALAPGQVVSTDDLPTEYRQPVTEAAGSNQTSMRSTSNDVTNWTAPLAAAVSAELRRDQGLRFHDFKAAFQKEVCLAALSLCQGNQSEAARRLGISRNTLAAALATRSDGNAATA
jgi:two-component system nitrogen regulation response regulator GlnG